MADVPADNGLDEALKKLEAAGKDSGAVVEEAVAKGAAAHAVEEVAVETAARKSAARKVVTNVLTDLQKSLTQLGPNGAPAADITAYRSEAIGNALKGVASKEFEERLLQIGLPLGAAALLQEYITHHITAIRKDLGIAKRAVEEVVEGKSGSPTSAEPKKEEKRKYTDPMVPRRSPSTWQELVAITTGSGGQRGK